MTIYQKLLNIQNELKAPKSQYNSFGKYNYRSCEDILEAAKPICLKHGASLYISDSVVQIGDRYYVCAIAALVNVDDPEQEVTSIAYAREEDEKKGMDGSQVTGSTSSYARKYALNGLFCIDDTKDSDATNNGPSSKKSKTDKPATNGNDEVDGIIGKIKAEINKKIEAGVERDAIAAALKAACGTAQYTKIKDATKAEAALNAVQNI